MSREWLVAALVVAMLVLMTYLFGGQGPIDLTGMR